MADADPYFLGYRQAEQARLERQSEELAGESAWLFDQFDLDGARAIEIGCGPRGCLELLSEYVGERGRVVGVERSEEQATRARQVAAESELTNVQVLHADARSTGLPNGTFDLATARLVLVNVPAPGEIITEMVRLVRSGGFVALHEADASTQFCEPPLPAWTRLAELLATYAELNGIDRTIGRKLPQVLRDAGLVDVHARPFVHGYPAGHGRRMMLLHFVENVRERLLEKRLIDAAELDEAMAALKRHLDDPNTLLVSSVFVQAWGRKP